MHIWRKKRVNYDKFLFLPFYRCCNNIYLVFTYVASFRDYKDDTFEVISNLHVQGFQFGRKINKFGRKLILKIELHGVHGVSFFQVWQWPKVFFVDTLK